MKKIRIGMMGFGRIGRQLYQIARADEQIEIVAISDIGQPEILHHLLLHTIPDSSDVRLDNNYLVCDKTRTRLMPADHPAEIPWDVFGVDVVIAATGRFCTAADLRPHLRNGAPRVVMAALPEGDIDRVILCGVNDATAQAADQIVSAGSSSTTAMGLALKVMAERHEIAHASLTSVHAYTSDQSLQDYAGADYRRSRSGAENIIPNVAPAPYWVGKALPNLAGKLSGYALNVPVHNGSMLDLTLSMQEPAEDIEHINNMYRAAAAKQPRLIQTTEDPIVSSDVHGCEQSLLVDLQATMRAGEKLIKVLAWHETLGQANRVMDVVRLYADLDATLDPAVKEAS